MDFMFFFMSFVVLLDLGFLIVIFLWSHDFHVFVWFDFDVLDCGYQIVLIWWGLVLICKFLDPA